MGPLLIFGASGHGLVVADAALEQGFGPIGFADDDPEKAGTSCLGTPVVAIGKDMALRWAREHGAAMIIAIGANRARGQVLRHMADGGATLATVVHPTAVVSRSAEIGSGTVIFAGAVVQPGARVGHNVILNTAATVDHEGQIGDHAHLSPGVHLGGCVQVGEGTHVGIGVSVIQGIRIGAWSVIGAGAAVVRDIGDGQVAVGVPARERRSLPQ